VIFVGFVGEVVLVMRSFVWQQEEEFGETRLKDRMKVQSCLGRKEREGKGRGIVRGEECLYACGSDLAAVADLAAAHEITQKLRAPTMMFATRNLIPSCPSLSLAPHSLDLS
jgi:hypothetical protein